MAEQWIDAAQSLELGIDRRALCVRLHKGLLSAKAASIHRGEERQDDVIVHKWFWWAEGHEALVQDWQTGDFSTWIDQKYQYQAFGVRFPLSGLLEMLPFEKRGLAARQLSVAGNPQWITSHEARLMYFGTLKPPMQVDTWFIEQAQLGFAIARAVLAQCGKGSGNSGWIWEEREWDVPGWFWTNFPYSNDRKVDFVLGRISGTGVSHKGRVSITLSGLHFHKETIVSLINGKTPAAENGTWSEAESDVKRGRRPTYDWPLATNAIWGKLHRGELIPDCQADIETALIGQLKQGDKEPSVSTVRPFASPIFEEFRKP